MRARHLLLNYLRLSIFVLPFGLLAQTQILVVDESNIALPGVNVSLDNRAFGSTDLDGIIEIVAQSEFTEIEFSYLGFENKVIPAKDITGSKYTVRLIEQDEIIEEVLIVGRTNALEAEIPFKVQSISAKEIKSLQAQTSADVLSKNGSVYVQKSQLGGGSPVIRGFEANKILLVVDGVRMNNAIYRGGHLQNAITIDPAILNRMELIYGPGSLLYGSDALGGVIHFRTKNPITDSKAISGGANIRYSSANQEKSAHVHFSLSNGKNLASLTSISFADFEDLKIGKNRSDAYPDWGLRSEYVQTNNGLDEIITNDDPNIQVGSSYNQFDLLQKVIFNPNERLNLSVNLQYSTSSDIPRYDFLSEYREGTLRYSEWYYGPQERLLISPRLEYNTENKLFDKLFLTTAYQKIGEDRITRNLNSSNRNYQLEALNIYSANVDFVKDLNSNQTFEYGASINYNALKSSAYDEDIISLEQNENVLTRYPSDGSSMSQSGVYILHRWNLFKDLIKWNAGLRFSNQSVSFDYKIDDPIQWPAYYYDGISNSNNSLVWMSGINIQKNDWQIKVLGGSAFRAPNVDDLAKVRVKADEITVPNPELVPEKTKNIEASFLLNKKRIRIGAAVFHSWIEDLIVRRDFTLPDGSALYVSEQDTLQVTANINAKKGRVFGGSFDMKIDLIDRLTLIGNINYTKGIATEASEEESPLDHIPPLYGRLGLEYTHGNWNHIFSALFNGEKPIDLYGGSADNIENATADGTPAWSTLSFFTSYEFTNSFSFTLGVENILDKHYRPFASGISGAGRNFVLSAAYTW